MAAARPFGKTDGLLAVLLIIRSKSGPKLVFHYPANPSRKKPELAKDASSDTESDISEDDENVAVKRRLSGDPKTTEKLTTNPEDALDHVLGYSAETLEKLLSPGRWSEKKKFEVCLDGITFLGHPVYALDDGSWAPKEDGLKARPGLNRPGMDDYDDCIVTAPDSRAQTLRGFMHISGSFDSQMDSTSFASSMTSSNSGVAAEQMTMFQVVFALQDQGRDLTPGALYEHVAKKLGKALFHCQQQASYVSNESRRLLATKAKARLERMTTVDELWKKLLESSELAWALKEVYDKISTGDIAGIRLNGTEMALQIPIKDYQQQPLTPQSALLILEDKEVLLRELESHPDASPLAFFIREHTPTKSLRKLAIRLGFPEPGLLFLARHLITWRKARAISPLHFRNTYIVSPNAPVHNLQELTQEYAQRFSALPTLPTMLLMMSAKPVRFGLLIPSREHRTPYMDILAWLVSKDIVVQLRTFGWLRRFEGDVGKASELPRSEMHANDSDESRPSTAIAGGEPLPFSARTMRLSDASLPEMALTSGLIANPNEPSPQERAVMDGIRNSLSDEELRDCFPKLVKHIDGKHALEEVAASEEMKRSKVEDWFVGMEKDGWLLTARYI